MNRILLVGAAPDFEHRVREAFGNELNGHLRAVDGQLVPESASAVLAHLRDDEAEVVVLGAGLPQDAALALAAELETARPDVSVVLVTETSAESLQRALQAGVRDVLAQDASPVEMRAVLDRAGRSATRRRAHRDEPEPPADATGRVLAVVSPKGGTGKTTVATNVAVDLATSRPGEVVIVDLDLQFGDVASALQLMPEHTLADAARAASALDAMTLKTFLTPHPGGLFALCAPDTPAEGERIAAAAVTRIVELLSHDFAHVVLDTGAGLGEHTLAALEGATDFVLVTSMDVPSVRSMCKEVQALDLLGMTSQQRHFVLNRADARVGLAVEDIEATVGLAVDVKLPSSRLVPSSLNEGRPVVESDPRSPVARSLTELAGRFAAERARRSGGRLPWRRNTR